MRTDKQIRGSQVFDYAKVALWNTQVASVLSVTRNKIIITAWMYMSLFLMLNLIYIFIAVCVSLER